MTAGVPRLIDAADCGGLVGIRIHGDTLLVLDVSEARQLVHSIATVIAQCAKESTCATCKTPFACTETSVCCNKRSGMPVVESTDTGPSPMYEESHPRDQHLHWCQLVTQGKSCTCGKDPHK